jgi:hypothetical protein
MGGNVKRPQFLLGIAVLTLGIVSSVCATEPPKVAAAETATGEAHQGSPVPMTRKVITVRGDFIIMICAVGRKPSDKRQNQ